MRQTYLYTDASYSRSNHGLGFVQIDEETNTLFFPALPNAHNGSWRRTEGQTPVITHSSGPEDSNGSRRNVRRDSRAPSRDFEALADALSHTYPASTGRDGNVVIADAKKAAKQAYLMHVANNMTSDDEAGVTDDSQDYSHYSEPCSRALATLINSYISSL